MPDWTAHLRPRFAQLRLSPEREREIIEELSHHLDQCYEDCRNTGASDEDARDRVLRELADPDTLEEYMQVLRQAHTPSPITLGAPRSSLLTDLLQDLRYAVRMLRRQPVFAAVAILTLALGIGANSAIFTLVDVTLLRPLPFPGPDRLVMLWEGTETSRRGRVAPANLRDWQERNHTFDAIAGFIPSVGSMVMSAEGGVAETVPRQWVTAAFFDVLGIKAIAGRTFLPSDERERAPLVVLGEAFWRARFNGDPGVVGRAIRLDGATFTIVGVVPKEFQLLGRSSIWGLMPLQGASPSARSLYVLQAIGRLKPGVTADAAGADMAAVAEGLAREYPNSNMGRGITLEPMRDALVGSELRLTSILFLAVVAFVLLLCCANVANLLLARATVRARELAIRSALGASRTRVVRQLLTESLVLSVAGGVVGLAVGAVILTVAPSFIPQGLLPAAVTLTFDARVVIFCAATTVLVGFLFGAAPAWQVTACTAAEVMASGNRSSTARGGMIRGFLVIGEVATAVVLLFCAGLLLRTLLAIERRDPGYRAESVLTMTVDPLDSRGLLPFYESVDEEIKTLPGVRSAAWASTLPFGASYGGQSLFEIVGEPPLPNESARPAADYQIVSPAYFQTLDLPVVAGRGFTDRDRRDSVPVCIVNEAFVRGPLQGRSPIGVRVALRPTAAGQQPPIVREIVGVARQVKGRPDETEDLVQVYVPLAQDTIGDIFLVVRPTSGPAEALAPLVRAAIARVDREQLVSVRGVMTLDNVRWEATASHRFRAVLVTAFAGLALVLAMVGLFGILAYSIQQRARDFGVRRALGATTGDVLRLVVGSAARVTAAGVVIGLALSTALGRLLASMLFGVQPSDPVTFVVVTLVLTLTAGVSTVGPAWRATRIDPAVALRSE